MFQEIFNFYLPTRVVCGPNSVKQAGEELKNLGCTKALVVTEEGVLKTGIIDQVTASLDTAGVAYAVFNGVQADPREEGIEKALGAYQKNGCDGIIAVGGGSSIDTAKAAGVVAANGGSIRDYEGAMQFTNPLPPLVCVPTTHGTGSEVSTALVITDDERKFKYFVGSPLIAPKIAILDPVLMVNLPTHLAASTGMDALSHAIGSFCSTRSQPFSECLALHSIRLVAANLRKAVTTDDLEATYNMVIASSLGMMAGSLTRLGTVHAMAHALGSLFHAHHGLACGLLMPYVMEFNLVSCPEKFSMIAQAMGERIDGLGVMEAAQMAVGAVQDLCADIGIPETLSELGVTEDSIPALAEGTMAGNVATNPRKTTYEDVVKLFEAAL